MVHEGAAVLNGAGTLASGSALTMVAASTLEGSGTLTSDSGVLYVSGATLGGVGILSVIAFSSPVFPDPPVFSDVSDFPYTEINLELSEREIYNDIRSEVDVTLEHVDVTDATYAMDEVRSDRFVIYGSSDAEITLTAPRFVTQWHAAYAYNVQGDTVDGYYNETQCINAGGSWREGSQQCWGITSPHVVTIWVRERTDTSIRLWIQNSLNAPVWLNVAVPYKYMVTDEETRQWTEIKTLTVRATDAESIRKYGRRVMNLVWPLGQSEEEMQSVIEAYRDRHKEPMPLVSMEVKGDSPVDYTLIEQILDRKISDRLKVYNDTLGIVGEEFFCNAIVHEHEAGRLLTAYWTLEQARDEELLPRFRLNISELNGTHRLG